jgi:hypothetical protein
MSDPVAADADWIVELLRNATPAITAIGASARMRRLTSTARTSRTRGVSAGGRGERIRHIDSVLS